MPRSLSATARRLFVIPLTLVPLAAIVVGIVAGWPGPIAAGAGPLLIMVVIGLRRFRSVSATPGLVLSGAGLVLSLLDGLVAVLTALAAVAVLALYVGWYSRYRRRPAEALRPGQPFPADVRFEDHDGVVVEPRSWQGSPTIVMFYRGAWCPLCSAQIQELARGYQDIADLGAEVVLIAPQPAEESRKLADQVDAPLTFLVDPGAAAARRIGIEHLGGAPIGLVAEGDTVMPTVLVLDADGVIRFVHETDNYRIRPEPTLFLDALRRLAPAR